MNRTWLIVALIMLAMVTFLVVAFVGFSRFERASVTASMRRTEATFASQDAMSIASSQIINLMTNGVAFGLTVSERINFSQFVFHIIPLSLFFRKVIVYNSPKMTDVVGCTPAAATDDAGARFEQRNKSRTHLLGCFPVYNLEVHQFWKPRIGLHHGGLASH